MSNKQQKQQQQQIYKERLTEPILEYDEELLQRINNRCLPTHSQIRIRYLGLDDLDAEDAMCHQYTMYLSVKEKEVSEIILEFGMDYQRLHDSVYINSHTMEEHRQRHYNTILRCVLILLMPDMKINHHPIKKVVSTAESYLSVYSLAKLGFHIGNGNNNIVDLSFYDPFRIISQQERVARQKQLKQSAKSAYEHVKILTPMVLLQKNYRKSCILAKQTLNRLCANCLIQETQQQHKRKPTFKDQQSSVKKQRRT